jgi:hypothetical protein
MQARLHVRGVSCLHLDGEVIEHYNDECKTTKVRSGSRGVADIFALSPLKSFRAAA